MKVYEDKFWRTAYPAFPDGCDPYNSADEVTRQRAALLVEMEQCWRSCLVPISTPPDMMIVDLGFVSMVTALADAALADAEGRIYEMHVPGRVSYPYGRPYG